LFTHLHTHSHWSLLEGLPSPAELVQAAAADGQASLALTDHRWLSGAIEFQSAARQAGIRPILGLELPLELSGPAGSRPMPSKSGAAKTSAANGGPDRRSVVLLACGPAGWANLAALSTRVLADPQAYFSAACPEDFFHEHAAGLICLFNPALQDPARERAVLERFAARLGDRLYIEFPGYLSGAAARGLAQFASVVRLPLAGTLPSYYLKKEHDALQRTLAAIRLNCRITDLPAGAVPPSGSHFQTQARAAALFRDLPAAAAASQEIADRCQFEIPTGAPNFPILNLPGGAAPAAFLRQKAEAGARELYGKITPAVQARLDHELAVIAAKGFEPIFLIVAEVMDFTRAQGIPTSSRGSAASSLVAHCLRITTPDPLSQNLYFERFLNPARSTPPDIDTDICSRRRPEVIQHIFETYGRDRVAMVGTVNRFRPRSALLDVAKAHGLPAEEIRRLTATLPYRFFHGSDDPAAAENPYAGLLSANPPALVRQVIAEASAILGLPDHLSVHPGGVIVSPGPMTDLVPVQSSGSRDVTITQFDLDALEKLGLVKIDLLGIRGLTVMGDVAAEINTWRKAENPAPLDVLEQIPADDPDTAALIQRGQTIGCFQIESPGMRATLRQIQADSIDDLTMALALYRPGPLKGGFKNAFVRRHNGLEKPAYLHPALEPLLSETYGVMLYQEQVLRVAHGLAGLSLAESDLLRRAMSHFDPGRQMQLLKEKFVAGALQTSRVPAAAAEQIWELMAAFAGYGFPKAHAASYALVAWRAAWLKSHYPAEFMAAVLANWGGYYSQRVYLTESRRLGLKVRPPHINHSRRQFRVAYPGGEPVLFMGLDQVRDLTQRTQNRVIAGQPYRSLADFLVRVDPRPQEAEFLVKVGALQGLGSIPALLDQLSADSWSRGQLPLFAAPPAAGGADWSLAQVLAAQEDILGAWVSAHPLDLAAGLAEKLNTIDTVQAAEQPAGARVRILGVRQSSHSSRTASGAWMAFLTIEDLQGMLDVVIFPELYRRVKPLISGRTPLVVEGTLEPDPTREDPILRAENIIPLYNKQEL
jgi:DNA-directed DNA polymerase III PolC